jgi:hypothetical protein
MPLYAIEMRKANFLQGPAAEVNRNAQSEPVDADADRESDHAGAKASTREC